MRGMLVIALCVVVAAAYGPPRPSNNACGFGGCGGGGRPAPVQTAPCGGNGCGGNTGGGSGGNGSGDYWWAGSNSPFQGPPASHVSVSSSSGSAKPHPVKPVAQSQPRPFQTAPALPQLPSAPNLVQPPMGICPAGFVCVHWQLCRNGFVISDGTGTINKRIKEIPVQVSSRYQSCGGDMICCGIPAGGLPAGLPAPQPQLPGVVSLPQVIAPAPQPPVPAPQPPVPAPQPSVIVPQPPKPATQPSRPNPSVGYGRPPPQNPLVLPATNQPNPQPTVSISANNVPGRPHSHPISNPVGLVSPPSPQPNPMMGGMMMMMGMPMRGGSCSAGTYCVQPNMCNPYTGFIIRDPSQLMAVWPDAPTVPLLSCFVPDGSIQNGVCCQEAHPNAGGFD